jgi:hypothetical protein
MIDILRSGALRIPSTGIVPLVLLAVLLLPSSCGDDDAPFTPVPKFREPTSAENVLFNFETAYNELDYDHFEPLLSPGFSFVFHEDDVLLYPDDIPPSGMWGRAAELNAHCHILDTSFVPQDNPEMAVKELRLELEFSGTPTRTSLEGAPEGTLEAFVTFDLRVYTVGQIDYVVNSRPRFYFAPDSSAVPVTWTIWMIEDAPFGQGLSGEALGGNQSSKTLAGTARSHGASPARPAVEKRSWGSIKAIYS